MEFRQHAPVFALNGEAVGHIDRVVVDPRTRDLTHIVVRKGFLFTEDKVVPLDLIAGATAERIDLRATVDQLQQLPLFEETHYVPLDDNAGLIPVVTAQPLGGLPASYTSVPAERLITQVERHIPDGTVALKDGARVVTADGQRLGHVERVITAGPGDHATHLLISHGLVSKERKLIPLSWVIIRGEDEVQLTVSPRLVDELSPYPG